MMGSGSAVRLELGIEIQKRVVEQGGSRDDIAEVLERRPDVAGECASLILRASRDLKTRLEFTLKIAKDDTFDSLVAAGKYDWKNDFITAKRFPVKKSAPGERKLVVLHFGKNVTSEAAIAEAEKQGLDRPEPEDAFRTGAQYPDLQRQFSVVFLHEPVRGSDGRPLVVVLLRLVTERDLGLRWFGNEWLETYRFAFFSK